MVYIFYIRIYFWNQIILVKEKSKLFGMYCVLYISCLVVLVILCNLTKFSNKFFFQI